MMPMHVQDRISDDDSAADALQAAPGVLLDHLAIGVRQWSDAYERFVGTLGGRWGYGGPSGDFAPYQLVFGRGMRLEFIAPNGSDGFMARFLARRGPAPHHVTFKTPALARTAGELRRLGFRSFGDRPDLPMWKELFVDHRESGIGTLVQIVEADDASLSASAAGGPPGDFPPPGAPAWEVDLFGLTTLDLTRAHELLVAGLHGSVTERAAGWFAVTWGGDRSILVRTPGTAPGGDRLWAGAPREGPAFLLLRPAGAATGAVPVAPDLADRAHRLPHDEKTGIPVWLLN
jgi:hypothetical protein